jgi:hypothetical protein
VTGDVKPFRVIYVEGGSYADYYLTLAGLVRGLHALGLVRDGNPPVKPDSTDTMELWQWLSGVQGTEGILEFPEDGFYSAGWSEVGRDKVRRGVAERIRDRGDVDLILAFGTRAGLDFVLDDPGVPVMSLSAIDPEGAGFAAGDGAEGRPQRPWAHVFVKRDRIPAQLSLFHGTFRFGRLGVPVEEDPQSGRLSMAWPAIEQTAAALGFTAVPCYASMEIPDRDAAFRNLMECLEILSRETEAIYLTVNNGMLRSRMGEILAPMAEAGIPSFSQEGSEAVRAGVLMSAGQDDYDDIGLFEARALREILNGGTPGEIPGIYRAHASVAINLTMALRIGWNPPFEILVAADRIYQGMAEPFRDSHPSWAVRTGGPAAGQGSGQASDGEAGGSGTGGGVGTPDGGEAGDLTGEVEGVGAGDMTGEDAGAGNDVEGGRTSGAALSGWGTAGGDLTRTRGPEPGPDGHGEAGGDPASARGRIQGVVPDSAGAAPAGRYGAASAGESAGAARGGTVGAGGFGGAVAEGETFAAEWGNVPKFGDGAGGSGERSR